MLTLPYLSWTVVGIVNSLDEANGWRKRKLKMDCALCDNLRRVVDLKWIGTAQISGACLYLIDMFRTVYDTVYRREIYYVFYHSKCNKIELCTI